MPTEQLQTELVVAGIVTYNRLGLLKNLVAALERQTWKQLTIMIVDNASSDGTKEWCEKRQKSTRNFRYLRLETNTGGAGGFHAAMEEFISSHSESDLLWLMDDDAEPLPDCLEHLVRGIPNQGVSAPRIIHPDGSFHQRMSYYIIKNDYEFRGIQHKDPEFRNDEDIHCFALLGLLIHRAMIERVGTVDSDLFIQSDDLDWTLRSSKLKPIRIISSACIYHHEEAKLVTVKFLWMSRGQFPESSVWKLYYGLRNQAIVKRKNGIYNPLSYTKSVIATVFWRIKIPGRLTTVIICWNALFDGLLGKTGYKIPPGYTWDRNHKTNLTKCLN